MKIFSDILEDDGVFEYLESRSLLERYRESKRKILAWNFAKLDLKKRRPKNSGIWSFRINQKYRALGYKRDGMLVVVEIDDH